jgi:D-3-phosphoglycerate dehydrogenase
VKVLVLDKVDPLLSNGLKQLGFVVIEEYEASKSELLSNLDEITGIIIRSRLNIDREILDASPKLRFIGRVGAGMENIDVSYAEKRGVHCFRAAEGNRTAVGEHALGMLLMLLNNIRRADQEVRSGLWRREENRGYELDGRIVGIVGYGEMGSAFAKKLSGLGVQVLAYDLYKTDFAHGHVKEVEMDFLFKYADILSLHVPETDLTRGMVNELYLNRFEKDIYLINTSRGNVVKTADLVRAMKTGKVLGACLDVLEYEKSSFENFFESRLPDDFRYLVESDRTILTPHIAGWTHESRKKMALAILRQIDDLNLHHQSGK